MMRYGIKDIRDLNSGNLKVLSQFNQRIRKGVVIMLISMNWINDFVDLSGLDLEKLIHQFTLSTAEVEDIYYMGRDIKDVVVARIVFIENTRIPKNCTS